MTGTCRFPLAAALAVSLGCFAYGPSGSNNIPITTQEPAPAFNKDADTLLPLSEAADRNEDIRALAARYPGQPAVCLENRSERETRLKGVENRRIQATLLHRILRRMVVFDPARQQWSSVSLDVPQASELVAGAFSILTPDGRYRTFGMESLKRVQAGDGSSSYRFALPGVAPGSVIGQSYVVRQPDGFTTSLVGSSVPLQMSIPCRRARFDCLFPSTWTPEIKMLLPGRPLSVKVSESWGTRTMTWEAEDLPAIPIEPFSPFFLELAAEVDMHFTAWRMDFPGYRPIDHKEPSDWEGLAQQYRSYAIARNPIFSQRVVNQTRTLTEHCAGERERLSAIVTWVQDNIRTVDWTTLHQAGLDDLNFAEILKRSMGGPSQVNGLVMEMLTLAGIDCRYLLMHSAEQGRFDPEFHSYRNLGFVGLLAKADGKAYVVFPNWQHMPIDIVPERFLGQPAMAIDRKGKSEFITIPLGNQAVNETVDTCKVTLQADGKVLVEEGCSLRGAPALALRNQLQDLSEAQTGRTLMAGRGCPGGRAVLKRQEITNLKDHTAPLGIRMVYEVDGLLSESGDTRVFDAGLLFDPAPGIKVDEAGAERRNPIRIYFDQSLKKSVTVGFPAAWTLKLNPPDAAVENAFGAFRGSFSAGQETLTAVCELELRKASEPKESYPALQALIGRRTRQAVPALVFQTAP